MSSDKTMHYNRFNSSVYYDPISPSVLWPHFTQCIMTPFHPVYYDPISPSVLWPCFTQCIMTPISPSVLWPCFTQCYYDPVFTQCIYSHNCVLCTWSSFRYAGLSSFLSNWVSMLASISHRWYTLSGNTSRAPTSLCGTPYSGEDRSKVWCPPWRGQTNRSPRNPSLSWRWCQSTTYSSVCLVSRHYQYMYQYLSG